MTDYRLYCLDEAGKFTKAHDIHADTDEQAIQLGRDFKLPVVCELWEHSRMVAKLEPHCA